MISKFSKFLKIKYKSTFSIQCFRDITLIYSLLFGTSIMGDKAGVHSVSTYPWVYPWTLEHCQVHQMVMSLIIAHNEQFFLPAPDVICYVAEDLASEDWGKKIIENCSLLLLLVTSTSLSFVFLLPLRLSGETFAVPLNLPGYI